MSGYEQGKHVYEIAKRTISNLEIIERIAKNERNLPESQKTAFEVTQLINSFVGLLIAPQSSFYDYYPQNPTNPELLKLINWCKQNGNYSNSYKENTENDFKRFIRHLRNAVAHMSLESDNQAPSFFVSASGDQITHIFFRDQNPHRPREIFEIKIPITRNIHGKQEPVLRNLVLYLSEEILNNFASQTTPKPNKTYPNNTSSD